MPGNDWNATDYDSRFAFVGRYGDDVLDLLGPVSGQRILDLGCGTGRHAADLAARGADVVGVDADEAMLRKAAIDHPRIRFVMADAVDLTLAALAVDEPFDACFSNAALHWMTEQERVIRNVRSVLRDGALFVAEMGGAGNIATLDRALRAALVDLGLHDVPVVANYFPTVDHQVALLEDCGFRVDYALWFRRPTLLAAGDTAADWTRHFRANTWAAVPEVRQSALADAVDRHAASLRKDDGWIADYCRLRFVAIAA
jgi:trans-aconitate methyltransferase